VEVVDLALVPLGPRWRTTALESAPDGPPAFGAPGALLLEVLASPGLGPQHPGAAHAASALLLALVRLMAACLLLAPREGPGAPAVREGRGRCAGCMRSLGVVAEVLQQLLVRGPCAPPRAGAGGRAGRGFRTPRGAQP